MKVVRLVSLGLLLTACACAAPLDNPERFTGGAGSGDAAMGCASDVDVEAELLPMSCGSSVCHNDGEAPAAGLDLVTPGMQERLGAAISGESCGSIPILVPGDPGASLLFQKLGPDVPCGSLMPLGQPAFSASDLACVSAWIEDMQ